MFGQNVLEYFLDIYWNFPTPENNVRQNDSLERQTRDYFTISDLIEELMSLNWRHKNIRKHVRRSLEAYKGDDYMRYINIQVPEYRRIGIYENYDFQVLLCYFPPLKGNPPHNHGDAHCCFKVMKGEVYEKQYRIPNHTGSMQWRAIRIYEPGEINETSKLLNLHSCYNNSQSEIAVAVVVYFPPLTSCYTYDESTGLARLALTPDSSLTIET
ncbi:cysteine dioxygenase type 1 [Biomphalaria glabrata]|nr:cysteine dioxygenase type 1 [Biomphalaria glabrata]